MKAYLAEFIGTFALIFIGAGAVCADAATGGKLGVTGVALAHGLTILAMVYAYGHISGGQFNPAVTAAMVATRRLAPVTAIGYWAAQLSGAAVAGWLLRGGVSQFVHSAPFLGACDVTNTTVAGGILIEAILTFLLVSVVWGAAVDPRSAKPSAGLAIGLTVTLDILMGGYSTGAAMNPARAFGPALATGHWSHHAVYWIGPLVGGVVAGLLYEHLLLEKPRSSKSR